MVELSSTEVGEVGEGGRKITEQIIAIGNGRVVVLQIKYSPRFVRFVARFRGVLIRLCYLEADGIRLVVGKSQPIWVQFVCLIANREWGKSVFPVLLFLSKRIMALKLIILFNRYVIVVCFKTN